MCQVWLVDLERDRRHRRGRSARFGRRSSLLLLAAAPTRRRGYGARARRPGPAATAQVDIITDKRAPLDVRVVLVGLVAWIVSPIDLIPEFIPVIGPLDDVVVAVVALRYTRRRMGAAALRERWRGTPRRLCTRHAALSAENDGDGYSIRA